MCQEVRKVNRRIFLETWGGVVIIAEGEENASREYSSDKVKKTIEKEMKKYGRMYLQAGV